MTQSKTANDDWKESWPEKLQADENSDTFAGEFSNIPQSWNKNDAHIIVFGNEKGGSGKSTSAMHVAIGLLLMGYNVGSIDLDARQGTFTRYLRNRFQFVQREHQALLAPFHMAIERSNAKTVEKQKLQESEFLGMAIEELSKTCDFIIIDTPGTDSFLSRYAHSHADTLITPMNDSFIDLDLLADIDPGNLTIRAPSIYTKMVNEQRIEKAIRNGGTLDWIIMRTRLSHINAKNKRNIGDLLDELSRHYDFRLAPGFGERVIYREMFLKGLTLLDEQANADENLSLSGIAARQEVRNLLNTLAPEAIKPLKEKLK